MKKIISFCLWGDNPKYTIGAIKNADLARDIYPGWICRYYISSSVPSNIVKELSNRDNTEVICLDSQDGWKMMITRFLAIKDKDVEVMIVRDCDSRLSLREKYAVDEWLCSGKKFHTMHDHPYHTVPILGGMWGVKNGFSNFAELAESWYSQCESKWQCDQDFLKEVVFPAVRNDIMNHDEFFRHIWGGKKFPSDRLGLEFVGQVFDENDYTVQEHLLALAKAI